MDLLLHSERRGQTIDLPSRPAVAAAARGSGMQHDGIAGRGPAAAQRASQLDHLSPVWTSRRSGTPGEMRLAAETDTMELLGEDLLRRSERRSKTIPSGPVFAAGGAWRR